MSIDTGVDNITDIGDVSIFDEAVFIEPVLEVDHTGAYLQLIQEGVNLQTVATNTGKLAKQVKKYALDLWNWLVRAVKWIGKKINARLRRFKSKQLFDEVAYIRKESNGTVIDLNEVSPGIFTSKITEAGANELTVFGDVTVGDLAIFTKDVILNKKMVMKCMKFLVPGVGQAKAAVDAVKAIGILTPIVADFIVTSKEVALLRKKYAGKTRKLRDENGNVYMEMPAEAYITIDKYIQLGKKILEHCMTGGNKEEVVIKINNTDDLLRIGKAFSDRMDLLEDQILSQYDAKEQKALAAHDADVKKWQSEADKIFDEYSKATKEIHTAWVDPGLSDEEINEEYRARQEKCNKLREQTHKLIDEHNKTYPLMKNYLDQQKSLIDTYTRADNLSAITSICTDMLNSVMACYVDGVEYRIDGQPIVNMLAPYISQFTQFAIEVEKEAEAIDIAGQNCLQAFCTIMKVVTPKVVKISTAIGEDIIKKNPNIDKEANKFLIKAHESTDIADYPIDEPVIDTFEWTIDESNIFSTAEYDYAVERVEIYQEALGIKNILDGAAKGARLVGKGAKALLDWIVKNIKRLAVFIRRNVNKDGLIRLVNKAKSLKDKVGNLNIPLSKIVVDINESTEVVTEEGITDMTVFSDVTVGDMCQFGKKLLSKKVRDTATSTVNVVISNCLMVIPGVNQAIIAKAAAKGVLNTAKLIGKMTPIVADIITTSKEVALLRKKYAGKTRKLRDENGNVYYELPAEAYVTLDKFRDCINRSIEFLMQGGRREKITIKLASTDDLLDTGLALAGGYKNVALKSECEWYETEWERITAEYNKLIDDVTAGVDLKSIDVNSDEFKDLQRRENAVYDEYDNAIQAAYQQYQKDLIDHPWTHESFFFGTLAIALNAMTRAISVYVDGEEYRVSGQPIMNFYSTYLARYISLLNDMQQSYEEVQATSKGLLETFTSTIVACAPKVGKFAVDEAKREIKNVIKGERSMIDDAEDAFSFKSAMVKKDDVKLLPESYYDECIDYELIDPPGTDAIELMQEALDIRNMMQQVGGAITVGREKIRELWNRLVAFIKRIWNAMLDNINASRESGLLSKASQLHKRFKGKGIRFDQISIEDDEVTTEAAIDDKIVFGKVKVKDISNFGTMILKQSGKVAVNGALLAIPGVREFVIAKGLLTGIIDTVKLVAVLTPVIKDLMATSKEIALLRERYAGKVRKMRDDNGNVYMELPAESYITIDKFRELVNRSAQYLSQGGKKEKVTVQLSSTDDLFNCGRALMESLDNVALPSTTEEWEASTEWKELQDQYEEMAKDVFRSRRDDILAGKVSNEEYKELLDRQCALREEGLYAVADLRKQFNKTHTPKFSYKAISSMIAIALNAMTRAFSIYVDGEEYRINGQPIMGLIAPHVARLTDCANELIRIGTEANRLGGNMIRTFCEIGSSAFNKLDTLPEDASDEDVRSVTDGALDDIKQRVLTPENRALIGNTVKSARNTVTKTADDIKDDIGSQQGLARLNNLGSPLVKKNNSKLLPESSTERSDEMAVSYATIFEEAKRRAANEKVRNGYLNELPENIRIKVMDIHKLIKGTVDSVLDDSHYEDLKDSSWAMSCIDDFCEMPKDKSDIGSFQITRKGRSFKCTIQATGQFRNHQYGWIEELLHEFMANVHSNVRQQVRKKHDVTLINDGHTGNPFEGFSITLSNKVSKEIWENQDFINESVIVFDEASKKPLKFDFRRAFDINTGHAIKIVYSLDDIEVTRIGDATSPTEEARTKRIQDVQDKIRLMGNLDHASTGQSVLAIIDRVTNERLQQSVCVGPYAFNWLPSAELKLDNERIKALQDMYTDPNLEDEYKSKFSSIKVGEVDTNSSFKSTFWPRHDTEISEFEPTEKYPNGYKREVDVVGGINTAGEHLPFGRGYRLNDLEPTSIVSSKGNQVKYKHPTKKEIRSDPELYREHLTDEEFEQLMKNKTPNEIKEDIESVQAEIEEIEASGDREAKRGLLAILRENVKKLWQWLKHFIGFGESTTIDDLATEYLNEESIEFFECFEFNDYIIERGDGFTQSIQCGYKNLPKGLSSLVNETNKKIKDMMISEIKHGEFKELKRDKKFHAVIKHITGRNARGVIGSASVMASPTDVYTGELIVTPSFKEPLENQLYSKLFKKVHKALAKEFAKENPGRRLVLTGEKNKQYFIIVLNDEYCRKLMNTVKSGKTKELKESTNTTGNDKSAAEAKRILRTVSQQLMDDLSKDKGKKMTQYTANIYANVITKNLLDKWAGGFSKLTITLDDYQSFPTVEFKVPKMTLDFVSRFIQGRETLEGFLHRQSEIKMKISPRVFHTMKNPDDAYNFFKAAITYYDKKLGTATHKLMAEAMKLSPAMKQLIGTTKLSGIVTYPMQLLFIFDDVDMSAKDTFTLSADDIKTVSSFIRNIASNYAAPEKEKKKIIEDVQKMVQTLRESAAMDENIQSLYYLPEAVADLYAGKFDKDMVEATERWEMEQVDRDAMHNADPRVKYMREAFGVKKLKKIPLNTIAYIQIETECIKDANDKMMISSYCLSKIELVEWYIELLDVGSKKYVVPHDKPYLVSMRTQLLACFKKIMATPIPKSTDRPLIDIQYPKGYEG